MTFKVFFKNGPTVLVEADRLGPVAEGVIDLAVLGDRLIHHGRDAFGTADVDLHGDGVALVRANFRGDFFRSLFRVIGDDDAHSILGQAAADVRADAARSTGDDDRFTHGAYS